ncbi:transferrin-a [Diretmus argenteus]
MKLLLLAALLGCLAAGSAAPTEKVRWCVTSNQELNKCSALAAHDKVFSCVQRISIHECIRAIKANEADAITLDGGEIYTAGQTSYDLQPIIAEDYGPNSCYYAVAVVKKGSAFTFNDLQGKKTCHTGVGKSAGWNIPIGTLLAMNKMEWKGLEEGTLETAVSKYFSASCAPGAGAVAYPKLCELCSGDCSKSHSEPYYNYDGAFKCLADGRGDVAFVKHLTVPDAVKDDYELLCTDGTRAAVSNYENCYLAKVPAHAVVSRNDPDLATFIYTSLTSVKGFNLFSSEGYGAAKNLMFKDSTKKLVKLPPGTDTSLYLGAKYTNTIRSLKREKIAESAAAGAIRWCAVGRDEQSKCDTWSIADGGNAVACQVASTVEDCLKKIMREEADAMALDGGQIYTAGKCGLVPVAVEQYDSGLCKSPGSASSYYAVAVVKKGSGVTWETLQGKRSCHTGMGRTAGWNIPMGQIHKTTQNCNFTEFFTSGCAPGAEPDSPFCKQCIGKDDAVRDDYKCKASADERYYGYAGAFRCLVDGAGDVAFIKHTIVPENSGGKGPAWALNVKAEDYELICPGKGPVAITEYESCNLALVPAHAVVTRKSTRNEVVRTLLDQQTRFGSAADGVVGQFRMFQSTGGKNLLFKDSTKCLQEIQDGTTFEAFLKPEYMTAMTSLRECADTASGLYCGFDKE